MSKKNESAPEPKTCFIIMPISDLDGYEPGHFKRVYEHIIKPACIAAGFVPVRADEVQTTNYIVIDILKRIITANMVVCDLSGKNPNVLYELGVRQAFNLPVTLIKDSRTSRVFDIQGLWDIEYDASLRIDTVEDAKVILENTLRNTSNLEQNDVNSILQLLGVSPARLPHVEVSPDTDILLKAIADIGGRLSRLEDFRLRTEYPVEYDLKHRPKRIRYIDKKGQLLKDGIRVRHPELGVEEVLGIQLNEIYVVFGEKGVYRMDPSDAAKELEIIIDAVPNT